MPSHTHPNKHTPRRYQRVQSSAARRQPCGQQGSWSTHPGAPCPQHLHTGEQARAGPAAASGRQAGRAGVSAGRAVVGADTPALRALIGCTWQAGRGREVTGTCPAAHFCSQQRSCAAATCRRAGTPATGSSRGSHTVPDHADHAQRAGLAVVAVAVAGRRDRVQAHRLWDLPVRGRWQAAESVKAVDSMAGVSLAVDSMVSLAGVCMG